MGGQRFPGAAAAERRHRKLRQESRRHQLLARLQLTVLAIQFSSLVAGWRPPTPPRSPLGELVPGPEPPTTTADAWTERVAVH